MSNKKILEENYQNYLVWGIVSPFEIHRIAWNINQLLDFKLKRQEDIIIPQKPKGDDLYFAHFKYINDVDIYSITLLKNSSQGSHFIKEMKNMDYLLLFDGETDFFDTDSFADLLKKLPVIHHAIYIPIKQIKSKNILYIS